MSEGATSKPPRRRVMPEAVDTDGDDFDKGAIKGSIVGFAVKSEMVSPSGRTYQGKAPHTVFPVARQDPHVEFTGGEADAEDMAGKIVRTLTGFVRGDANEDEYEDTDEYEHADPHGVVHFEGDALNQPDMHGRVRRKLTAYVLPGLEDEVDDDDGKADTSLGDSLRSCEGSVLLPQSMDGSYSTLNTSVAVNPRPRPRFAEQEVGDMEGCITRVQTAFNKGFAGSNAVADDEEHEGDDERAVCFAGDSAGRPDMHGRINRKPTMYERDADQGPKELQIFCPVLSEPNESQGAASTTTATIPQPTAPQPTSEKAQVKVEEVVAALGGNSPFRGTIIIEADHMTVRIMGDAACSTPISQSTNDDATVPKLIKLMGLAEEEAAMRYSISDEEGQQRWQHLTWLTHTAAQQKAPRAVASPVIHRYTANTAATSSPRTGQLMPVSRSVSLPGGTTTARVAAPRPSLPPQNSAPIVSTPYHSAHTTQATRSALPNDSGFQILPRPPMLTPGTTHSAWGSTQTLGTSSRSTYKTSTVALAGYGQCCTPLQSGSSPMLASTSPTRVVHRPSQYYSSTAPQVLLPR